VPAPGLGQRLQQATARPRARKPRKAERRIKVAVIRAFHFSIKALAQAAAWRWA
jgi:hypothetical protein